MDAGADASEAGVVVGAGADAYSESFLLQATMTNTVRAVVAIASDLRCIVGLRLCGDGIIANKRPEFQLAQSAPQTIEPLHERARIR